MILQLRYYGDPILRVRCREIPEVSEEIKQLARDLIDTMHAHDGVGLAAPQVGVDLRIFIGALQETGDGGYIPGLHPTVYINPEIVEKSEKEELHPEGCMSIPGLYEEFYRPVSITMKALDIEGKPFITKAKGWQARNLMHENDHLNGVLTIDRVGKRRRQQLEPQLKKIKKKYSGKK